MYSTTVLYDIVLPARSLFFLNTKRRKSGPPHAKEAFSVRDYERFQQFARTVCYNNCIYKNSPLEESGHLEFSENVLETIFTEGFKNK